MANLYVWVDERQREALTQRVLRLHQNAGYFRDLPVDADPVEYLIHVLFPDGQPCRFHAANISLAAAEEGRTKLALRPAIDAIGDPRFPRGSSLALSGSWDRRVPQPIFIVSSIAEISDCDTRDFERVLDVFVYHHDPQGRFRRDDNVLLSEVVLGLPLISRITEERLKDWDEFVRWKRKLVQASAAGLRFAGRSWLDDIRYQGREKDVVLVSLVRNDGRIDEPGRVQRRRSSRANVARYEFINVALSRARNLLIALGARSMFESYEVDLPNMDQPGHTRRPLYREMFQQLERDARLFEARKVLAPERPPVWRPTGPSGRNGRTGGPR